MVGGRSTTKLLGRHAQGLAVFLAYTVIALLLWGLRVIPHLPSMYINGDFLAYSDLRFYTWALGWWPHAILHGLNPLHAGVVWAPHGVSMALVTGLPGPALIFAPITLSVGPVVSENILFLLAPPLAAWASYLLCRHVTDRFWPSVVGGYFFGFSTYLVAEMRGHLNLVLAFPVPICVYLVLRRLDGSLSRARFVGFLSAVLLLQLSISLEVFLTMTLLGGLSLLGVTAFGGGERRRSLLPLFRQLAMAYAIVGVAAAPYLLAALPGPSVSYQETLREHFSADLLGFVVPSGLNRFGSAAAQGVARRFLTTPPENGTYIGVPGVLLVVLFAVIERRRRLTWGLLALLALTTLLALGPVLHMEGRASLSLPWRIFGRLPGLREALPVRLTMYTSLVIAVVVAVWLASPSRAAWLRWALMAVAAVAIIPVIQPPGTISVPPFFAKGTYRRYLKPGETVLAIPFYLPSDSMAWQAAARYEFALAGGYVGFLAIPDTAWKTPGIYGLVSGNPGFIGADELHRFVSAHHVGAVIVIPSAAAHWQPLLGRLGVAPITVEGMVVYELHPY